MSSVGVFRKIGRSTVRFGVSLVLGVLIVLVLPFLVALMFDLRSIWAYIHSPVPLVFLPLATILAYFWLGMNHLKM